MRLSPFASRLPSGLRRSLTAFLVPFVVYLLTLAPTIAALDSAELTTAAATLGISRATGYPLYTLIGRLFSLLPVGDTAYRLNLFSALMGALTILLVERIFQRLRVRDVPALAAAGLLAFAPYYWSLSLVAEVYTLNTALIASAVLAALTWAEDPKPGRLILLGLLSGLGLAHHGSFLLVLPGVLLLAAASHPRVFCKPAAPGAFLAGAAGGLLPYLYLPLRYAAHPVFNYAGHFDGSGVFHPVDLTTLPGLWWLVSGQAFAASMFSYSLPGLLAQIELFAGQISRGFLFIGLGPALLGLAVAFKKSRPLGSALMIMFLPCAAFYLDYDLADKATMFLPCYLVVCLWIGLGFDRLQGWIEVETYSGILSNRLSIGLQALMAVGVLAACLCTWKGVDRSGDWTARRRGESILREVKSDAVVVGYWDVIPVLQYLTLVEKQRSDLLLINRFLISDENLEKLAASLVGERPFYVDDRPDMLPPGVRIETSPAGLLELLPDS